MAKTFEPKILAFLCNWCAYSAADLAGVSRFQYPPSIRVIRVMCSGRVDPLYVINGLESGFDSVFVSGWHFGDCHYQDGNVYAEKRMEVVEYLLDLTGIGRNRMQLRWVSSAEGQLFADYVTQYSDQTRDMGPFETDRFQLQLSAARRTLDSSRIRWLTGMNLKLTEEGNVYNEKINKKEYTDMLHKAIGDEYEKALVLEALGSKPQLVREISQKTELPVYAVSSRLVELKTDGLAEIKDYDGADPLFIRLAA